MTSISDATEPLKAPRALPEGPHFTYVLVGKKKSSNVLHYIGYTNDLDKRLKQHNGLLKGGARSTKGGRWKLLCSLTGFKSYGEALAAEWRFKHPYGRRGRSQFSANSLEIVLNLGRWSRKHSGLDLGNEERRVYTLSIDKKFATQIDKEKLHKAVQIIEF